MWGNTEKFKSYFGSVKYTVMIVMVTSVVLLFSLNYDVIINVGISQSYFESSLRIPPYLSKNFSGYVSRRNDTEQLTAFKEIDVPGDCIM